MFRRVFSSARKGLPFAAASVMVGDMKVLSNDELLKKPKWYSSTVIKLEEVLKELSRYQPIESSSFLHSAIDILRRVEDVNNAEISWRLTRALVEEAEWIPTGTQTISKKIKYLEEAIETSRKILSNPNSSNCTGLHKWYAIALRRLAELKIKHALLTNTDSEIPQHFEMAIKLDPNDPFTCAELASYYRDKNSYKNAIKYAKAAEKIRPNFSNVNLLTLGASLFEDGQKDEGLKILKQAASLKPENILDNKAWFKAKLFLLTKAKIPKEEVDKLTWEY